MEVFSLSNTCFVPEKCFFHCLSVWRFVSRRAHPRRLVWIPPLARRRADRAGRHRPVCWSELATMLGAAVARTPQLAAAPGTCSSGAHPPPAMSFRVLSAHAPLGRKTLLSPAGMTRLSEHIMRVSDVMCFSAVTITRLGARMARRQRDSTSVLASGGSGSSSVACS